MLSGIVPVDLAHLAAPLRLLPAEIPARALAMGCNQLLKGQSTATRLEGLAGRTLRLEVEDLGLALDLEIEKDGLRAGRGRAWDVRIRGRLIDFVRLAVRAEDPDTLFFDRRLSLEGDTETGLYVKNVLDALEFDLQAHLRAQFGPYAGEAAYRAARALQLDRLTRRLGGFIKDRFKSAP